MRFIYNILFAAGFLLNAPAYFLKLWRRGHWRQGLGERFGFYGAPLRAQIGHRPVLWLHAVSVGEVGVCLQLLRALEPALPAFQIAVSTTTSTGMGELRRKLPPHLPRFYYPIDSGGAVRRALQLIRPRAVIFIEAELWPNFLWQALERQTPLFLVNARISDNSFRNYQRGGFIFRPIFARFRGVTCQLDDAGRLETLGFPRELIRAVGNLKFDAAQPDPRPGLDAAAFLRRIGVPAGAPVMVAGSTHPGEEAMLAEMLPRWRKRFPNLFLVIVPRHFERAKEVGQELEARGVAFVYRSEVTEEKSFAPGALQCLVVNSTGELKSFYEAATVVFVGKSVTAHGGQNPIEPAALGKAVVFGPNMENFAAVVRAFVKQNAVLQARDAAALEQSIGDLLADDARRAALGERARRVVEENLGATARTVAFIKESLAAAPLHHAPPNAL